MVWEADKTSVAEVAKKRGDDDARCALQPHFGGMNADDARRLKALELPAMWLPPDRCLPRTRGTQDGPRPRPRALVSNGAPIAAIAAAQARRDQSPATHTAPNREPREGFRLWSRGEGPMGRPAPGGAAPRTVIEPPRPTRVGARYACDIEVPALAATRSDL